MAIEEDEEDEKKEIRELSVLVEDESLIKFTKYYD